MTVAITHKIEDGRLPEYPPEQFPLMNAARGMTNQFNRGNCFHVNAALVMDLPHGDVCVGVVRGATEEELERIPNASLVPFIHCWTEQNGWVMAPTTIDAAGGKLLAIPHPFYYERNGIKPETVKRINRAGIKRLAKAHGWDKAHPFGNGAQIETPLGDTLLQAMGVEYEVNERGGIIPVGLTDEQKAIDAEGTD